LVSVAVEALAERVLGNIYSHQGKFLKGVTVLLGNNWKEEWRVDTGNVKRRWKCDSEERVGPNATWGVET